MRIGTLDELAATAEAGGVEVLTGVSAVGWYDGLVAAIAADAHLEIRAGAIVAATGSYDRVPLVPGADRPGVMAARTVIGLVDRFGIRPGDRVVLVGTGPEIETAGEALSRAGATELIGPIPGDALVSVGGARARDSAVVRAERRDTSARCRPGRLCRPQPEPRSRPRGGCRGRPSW